MCVNPPRTGLGSLCGSNDMVSPGLEAGGVVEMLREAAGLKALPSVHCRQGPTIRRMSVTSLGVRLL